MTLKTYKNLAVLLGRSSDRIEDEIIKEFYIDTKELINNGYKYNFPLCRWEFF